MTDPVVVTAAEGVSALGASLEATRQGLLAGRSGIRAIRRLDPDGFPVRHAAEVLDLDEEAPASPGKRRVAGLAARILSRLAGAASRSADVAGAGVDRGEIAFFAGLGGADYDVAELLPAVSRMRGPDGALDYRAFFVEHHRRIPPLWLLSQMSNIVFCQTAIAFDLQGDNSVLSQHGDAGAQAVADGLAAVEEGRAAIALVAGVGEEITPVSLARYLLLSVLSTASSGECRPFAADRSGTVLGEGGGLLVLERRSAAVARGAPSLAVLGGIGSACELDKGGVSPTPGAIRQAMLAALVAAGIGPEDIDLVIANGDGSPVGDGHEMAAIAEAFAGVPGDPVAVVSFKGAVGHLLAGAPLLDAALAVRMLQDGVVPAMAPGLVPDPACRLHLLTGSAARRRLRWIVVNTQGFSGQCVSMVFGAQDLPGGKG